MKSLRRKMIEDMRLKGLGPSAQKEYLRHVRQLSEFFNESPDKLNEDHLRSYMLHLIHERKLSYSSVKHAQAGFKFFYQVTLDREMKILGLVKIKVKKKLPVILNRREVLKLFRVTTFLKHRALLMTAYSTALRVGEVTQLRVADIDSERMLIHVYQGKKHKDRYVVLSHKLLPTLRTYYKQFRPHQWLFYGRTKEKPMAARTAQEAFKKASEKAGITKKVSFHSLRHACATHMMENGVNFRYIQETLGHSSPETTMIYTHVCNRDISRVESPLDTLNLSELP